MLRLPNLPLPASLLLCRSSHVVSYLGVSIEKDQVLIVTEYMEGGDLLKALQRKDVTWEKG